MLKPLTSEEVVRVSLATKGECHVHRRWPQDVVRAFALAEVITTKEEQSRAAETRLFRRVRNQLMRHRVAQIA